MMMASQKNADTYLEDLLDDALDEFIQKSETGKSTPAEDAAKGVQSKPAVAGNGRPGSKTEGRSLLEERLDETLQSLKGGRGGDQQGESQPEADALFAQFEQLWKGLDQTPAGGSGGGDVAGDLADLDDDTMEQLVASLLSKDLLFDPLKELDEKYPAWIEKYREERAGEAEYEGFVQQAALLKELLGVWERSEGREPSEQEKETALTLLQAIQDLGSPPAELMGPSYPGDAGQAPSCPVM